MVDKNIFIKHTIGDNPMKKVVCLVAFLYLLLAFAVNADEVRIWTSVGGTHKTEAEYRSPTVISRILGTNPYPVSAKSHLAVRLGLYNKICG